MTDDPLAELRQAVQRVKEKRASERAQMLAKEDAATNFAYAKIEPLSRLIDAINAVGINTTASIARIINQRTIEIYVRINGQAVLSFDVVGDIYRYQDRDIWTIDYVIDDFIGLLIDRCNLESAIETALSPSLGGESQPNIAESLAPVIAYLADRENRR